jgi:Protein of unknown function (DUF3352)
MMKRMRLAVSMLCLLALCASTWAAPSFEKVAPKDSLGFVYVRDVRASVEKFKKHSAYALWKEPSLQAFLEKAIARVNEKLEEAEGKAGIKLQDVLDIFQGQMGMYVTGNPDEDGHVVILFEVGDHSEKAREIMATLIKKAREEQAKDEAGAEIRTETAKIGGAEVIKVFDGEEDKPELLYTITDQTFILTNNADAMETAIDRIRKVAATSIIDNDTYVTSLNRIGMKCDFVAFVDTSAILKLVQDELIKKDAMGGEQIRKTFDALGLNGLLGLSIGSEIKETEAVSRIFINMIPEPKGVLTLFTQEPGVLHTADHVPANAVSFITYRFDLVKAYDEFEKIMNTLNPQAMVQMNMMMQGMAQQAKEPFNLRNDVLSVFGPTWSMFQTYKEPLDENSQRIVLAVDIPGKEAFKALWAKLGRINPMLGMMLKHRDYMGFDIYTPNKGPQQPENVEQNTFVLSVTDKQLILSNNIQTVEALIRRVNGKGNDSLEKTAVFKNAMKALPDEKHSLMTFSNPKPQIELLLNSLRAEEGAAFLGMMRGNAEVAEWLDLFDFSKLPPNEIFLKHLVVGVGAATRVEDGLLFRSWSPAKPMTK